MPTRTRKTPLKRNKRGWFPKEIGYLDSAKNKQPRFNLGTDEKEAEKRLVRIQDLFEDCERATGVPIWTSFALYAAKLISKGIYQIPLRFDRDEQEEVFGQETLEDACANYVQFLRSEQARYPSLQIVPDDEDAYAYGVRLNSFLEQAALSSKESELKNDGVITSDRKFPERFISGTLHEAFDRYVRHIEKTENKLEKDILKPAQRKRIEYVEVLKQHHADRPLMDLSNYDAIAELIGYWANRPEYLPGKRYKPTTARHRRKELETTSQIAKLTKFRGKDGKIRRKNRRILANTENEVEKAKEVIDQLPEGNSILSVPSAKKKARLVRSQSQSSFDGESLPENDDALQLLHCRLQDLKKEAGLESGSVQVILTDPPYERAWMDQWRELGMFAADVLVEGGLLVAHCGIFSLPEVMTSLGRHLTYRWTLSTSWSGSGNTQFVGGKSVLNKWLPILVFSKGKPNFPKGFSDTIQCDVQEKEHHKWQQPVEVFQRLVEDFSVPGDLVVDPCGGSFTTAIACIQAAGQRRFIGCDVDEQCVHIGHKRLKEELTRHASAHKKPLVDQRVFHDDSKPVPFTCSPRPQRSCQADNRVMLTYGGS